MRGQEGEGVGPAKTPGASRRVVGIKASTQRVVDYFRAFHAEHGKRPTMKMAAEALGFRSSSVVHHHLNRAERLGVKIPGESSFVVDADIRALSACVKALETCTPEGLRANLHYLADRFSEHKAARLRAPEASEGSPRTLPAPQPPAGGAP